VRFGATDDETLPGTGLGLAICRSIVDLHGGHIRAMRSQSTSGLDIEVQIPAAA
jgi:signal transduction histidine kinase